MIGLIARLCFLLRSGQLHESSSHRRITSFKSVRTSHRVTLTRGKKLCYLYGSIGNGDRVALVARPRNSFPSLGTRGFDLMGDDMTQRAAVDRYSIYSFVTKRWTRWRDEFAEAKAPIVGLRGRSSHLSRSKRRDATLPLKR